MKKYIFIILALVSRVSAAGELEMSFQRFMEIKSKIVGESEAERSRGYFWPPIYRGSMFEFDRVSEKEGKFSAMYVDGSDQESVNFISYVLSRGEFRSLTATMGVRDVVISFMVPEVSLKPISITLTSMNNMENEIRIRTANAGTWLREQDLLGKSLAQVQSQLFRLVEQHRLMLKKVQTSFGVNLREVYYGAADWQADEILRSLKLQFSPVAREDGYYVRSDEEVNEEQRATSLKAIAAYKAMQADGLVYIDHRVHANNRGAWTETNPALKKSVIMTKQELADTWEKERSGGVYATGTTFQLDMKKAISELEARGYVYFKDQNRFVNTKPVVE